MNQISTSLIHLPTEYVHDTAANIGVAHTLAIWLDVLSAVLPPRGTLLVGAGSGTGPWVQWLKRKAMHSVWLVEGDEVQHQKLQHNLPTDSTWNCLCTVLAPSTEPTNFYCASNPAENGLIEPEQLQGLWPNLRTRQKKHENVPSTLDTFSTEVNSCINWLILDCLPAAQLLQGGNQMLENIELVLLRMTIEQIPGNEAETQLSEADELLYKRGFKRIALQPERNPALAHGLYVLDTNTQIEQLSKEKATLASLASEREKRIDDLAKDKTSLAAECDALKQQELELRKETEALKEKNNKLKIKLKESLQKRQTLLEEMDKAEAQLDLIKDMLRLNEDN